MSGADPGEGEHPSSHAVIELLEFGELTAAPGERRVWN